MNRLLFGLLILVAISYAVPTDRDPVTDEDIEEFHYDCKKIVWKIAKKVLQQFRQCSAELKKNIPDDKERSKYIQCSVKCTLKNLELVNNHTGLITVEDSNRFLAKMIKPQFFDVGRVIIGGCVEEFDAVSEADRNDEHCGAYGEVLKCLQHQVTDVTEVC